MTVITFRAGIMAADTAVWNGDVMCGETSKIARMPSGALIGSAGSHNDGELFKRWAADHDRECNKKGEAPTWEGYEPASDEFEAMIVEYDGAVLFVDGYGLVGRAIHAPFYSIGAGAELAFGLMQAGHGAELAVLDCIYRHAFCAGVMQVEHLHPPASNVTHLFTKPSASAADEIKLAS